MAYERTIFDVGAKEKKEHILYFDNDIFEVERIFSINEEASVQYLPNPIFGPSISFSSTISCSDITLVFNSQIDANAWFVALAYCINISPEMNLSKHIFNMYD